MYVITVECLFEIGTMTGWVGCYQADTWEDAIKIANTYSPSAFRVTIRTNDGRVVCTR